MRKTILSPYYRVVVKSSNNDITNFITSLKFCDSVEEDDVLSLTLLGVPISLLDSSDISEGNLLKFSFGYLQGFSSGTRLARISNLDYSYGSQINLTIKALDFGSIARKGKVTKVWNEQSIEQICLQIAEQNGMRAKIKGVVNGQDKLAKVLESVGQTNEDDITFLKRIIQSECGGDIIVQTNNDVLIVGTRDLGSTSQRRFIYNNGDGVITSFKPSSNDTTKDEGSAETEAVAINPETGEEISSDGSQNAGGKKKSLGSNKINYDVNGNEIITDKKEPIKKKVISTAKTQEEADSVANEEKTNAELEDVTATLEINGDATITANGSITIDGVAKKHLGNWFVTKVSHNISNSGFTTSIELNKNASNRGKGEGVEGEVNDSTGKDDAEKTVKVKQNVYNVDGFEDPKAKANSPI